MRWLQGLYVVNGISFGVFAAFTSVLLQSRGFDAALVGLSGSLSALAYMFALPAWGHLGDKLVGARRALQLAVVPAGIFALLYDAPLPTFALVLAAVGFGVAGGPLGALTDAMAVAALPDPTRQYGRLRLLTSIGVAAGALGTGFLCEETGYWVTPWLFAATAVGVLLCVQLVPIGRDSDRSREAAAAAREAAAPAALGGAFATPGAVVGTAPARPVPARPGPRPGRFGSVSEALAGRPRLLALLASVVLLFIGIMSGVTFLGLRLADLGGGASSIGTSYALSGIAEVTGMVLGTAIATRYGIRTLLGLSAAGDVLCLVLWAVLTDPILIVLSRTGGGLFFAGTTVSFVLTIAAILPSNLQATGQTLYAASAFGAGAVIANFFGGIVYDALGPSALFGGGAVLGVLGGIIGVLAVPRHERVRRSVAADGVTELLPSTD